MKNIIIIQLGPIDDIMQTIPLQANIKYHHPDSHLTLLCAEEFKSIVSTFNHVDTCLVLSAKQTFRLKSLTQPEPELLKKVLATLPFKDNYDLLINCNLEIGVAMLATELKAIEKKGRTYWPGIPMYIQDDWSKYLFAFTQFRKQNLFNMADIYTLMAGLKDIRKKPLYVQKTEDKNQAGQILHIAGWNKNKKLVILQLGSGKNNCSWGTDHFAETARLLINADKVQILLIGSQSQQQMANKFMQQIEAPVINLLGKISLEQLPAVLSQADLMITNDTGPMHIAALTNTPLLVINLATAHFAEIAPYGEGHIIVHADLTCYPCLPGHECEHMQCREMVTPLIIAEIAQKILKKKLPEQFEFENIQIYKTVFKDHLLSFQPLSVKPGDHYAEGYSHRFFWEAFLNIPHKSEYSTSFLQRDLNSPVYKDKFLRIMADLKRTANMMEKGNAILTGIENEFTKKPFKEEKVTVLLKQFQAIESYFSENQNSIFKVYHLLDLGSIEQKQFTLMIQQIHKKYQQNNQQLQKVLNLFSSVL